MGIILPKCPYYSKQSIDTMKSLSEVQSLSKGIFQKNGTLLEYVMKAPDSNDTKNMYTKF